MEPSTVTDADTTTTISTVIEPSVIAPLTASNPDTVMSLLNDMELSSVTTKQTTVAAFTVTDASTVAKKPATPLKAWFSSLPAEMMDTVIENLPWDARLSLARTNRYFWTHPKCDFFRKYPKRFDKKNGTAARRREILNELINTAATDPRFIGQNFRPCSHCGLLKPPNCFTGDNLRSSRLHNCYCIPCGIDPMNSLLGRGARMDRPGNPGMWCIWCGGIVFGYQAEVKGRFCRVCRITGKVERWMVKRILCMRELRDLGADKHLMNGLPQQGLSDERASAAETSTAKSPFLRDFCRSHEACQQILDKVIHGRSDTIKGRRMTWILTEKTSTDDPNIEQACAKEGTTARVSAAVAMTANYPGKELLAASREAKTGRELAKLAAKLAAELAVKWATKGKAERAEQARQEEKSRRLGFNVPFEEGDKEEVSQPQEDSAEEESDEESGDDEGGEAEGDEEEGDEEEPTVKKAHKPSRRRFLTRDYPTATELGYPYLTPGSKWWNFIRWKTAEAAVDDKETDRPGRYKGWSQLLRAKRYDGWQKLGEKGDTNGYAKNMIPHRYKSKRKPCHECFSCRRRGTYSELCGIVLD
ncbi:hypothetical protein MMC30_006901 [Trapelia coarctata]|nr:hypothetical protein [Trapelia coarctata]